MASPAGTATWALSTECMPAPEGAAHCVAVLSNDTFVSGSDDHMVSVWKRIPGTTDFSTVHVCPEAQHQLRAIEALPPSPALPTGGFAAAGLDKTIRIYSYDEATGKVDLVRSLSGHIGGVISLSQTPDGLLISGGWEGHARVWDIATGSSKFVLEGHENGTSVLGLPNGDIVTGSTGRKDEHDRHVDFKIRFWRKTSAGGPTGYSIFKVVTDHDQAVRAFALLSGGAGFVSVANDGTAKVRRLDGSVLQTFINPVSAEGKPYFCFGVAPLALPGCFATCNEDLSVRVYGPDGLTADILHPGQPWAAACLPGGDLVTSGSQASRRTGHVYVWSADPARATVDEMLLSRFAEDMKPPPKPKPAGDDAGAGGSGGGSGGGLPDGIKISACPYESRDQLAGTKDGQYGFFRRADGAVMACAWSAAAGVWTDVGTLEDGDEAMAGAGTGGGAAGGGAAPPPPGGKPWDYVRGVTMETAQGMRSLQLCWNESDDPNSVASGFIQAHSLAVDNFEEVRNFILAQKAERPASERAAAAAASARSGPALEHLPTQAFVLSTQVDWKKVIPKVAELNALVAGDAEPSIAALACSEAELDAIRLLADVLSATARYHATAVPPAAVKALFRKMLRWPLDRAFPAIDVLRVLLTHPDGSAAVAAEAGSVFVSAQTERIAAARLVPALRPVVLLTARALGNACAAESTRLLILGGASAVLDCAADLLQYDNAPVRAATCTLLHNVAHAMHTQARRAQLAGGGGGEPNPDHVDQLLALTLEGLSVVGGAAPERADAVAAAALLLALGTVARFAPRFAATARSLELPEAVAAAARALPAVAALAAEVLIVLR